MPTKISELPAGQTVRDTDGNLIVRQIGGVVGTDEVRIRHDGSVGIITCMDGGFRIVVDAATNTQFQAGGIIYSVSYTAINSGQIGWSSSGAVAGAGLDTGFLRVAANVAGLVAGDWFQQTPGRSRVTTADVTNITTVLAAITGLSATVIAARKYTSGRILLYVEEVTAADGIVFDLDGGTATWTSFRATYKAFDTSSTTAMLTSGQVSAIATDVSITTITGAAWIEIEYSGVCNAGGTLIPRFAKEADAAGAALTVRVDSFMSLEDCP